MALAGDDQPGEGFLGKVRRLQTAKTTTTEQVLREILPVTEEDQAAEHRHPGADVADGGGRAERSASR